MLPRRPEKSLLKILSHRSFAPREAAVDLRFVRKRVGIISFLPGKIFVAKIEKIMDYLLTFSEKRV